MHNCPSLIDYWIIGIYRQYSSHLAAVHVSIIKIYKVLRVLRLHESTTNSVVYAFAIPYIRKISHFNYSYCFIHDVILVKKVSNLQSHITTHPNTQIHIMQLFTCCTDKSVLLFSFSFRIPAFFSCYGQIF